MLTGTHFVDTGKNAIKSTRIIHVLRIHVQPSNKRNNDSKVRMEQQIKERNKEV